MASPCKASGFALEFLQLLESSEDLSTNQTVEVPGLRNDASPAATATATAIQVVGAETAQGAAPQTAGKRSTSSDWLLMAGFQHPRSSEATPKSSGLTQAEAPISALADAATEAPADASQSSPTPPIAAEFALQESATLQAAAQAQPAVVAVAGGALAVPLQTGNARPVAARPASRPGSDATAHLALPASAFSAALFGSVQPDLSGPRLSGPQVSSGDARILLDSSLSRGLVTDATFQPLHKGEAGVLNETPQTVPNELADQTMKPELAFGARLNAAAAATPQQAVVESAHGVALDPAHAKAEVPDVVTPDRVVPASGKASSPDAESSFGGQSHGGQQQPPLNGNPPAPAPTVDQAPAIAAPARSATTPAAALGSVHAEPDSLSASKAPMRELALRMTGDGEQSAEVHLVERNGEIQVAVRASDPRLADSLRSNVNDLVNNLSHNELSADVWHPGMSAEKSNASDARQEPGGHAAASQQGDSSSSHSGGKQGGREDSREPEWLEELDRTPTGNSARKFNMEKHQ